MIIPSHANDSSNRFRAVAESFLQQPGLPFAHVLSAEDIRQAFADCDGLFASGKSFSADVVLWAFLAQRLRDQKAASCNQAVEDIRAYPAQKTVAVLNFQATPTPGRPSCSAAGRWPR